MQVGDTDRHRLHIRWSHPRETLALEADLRAHHFTVLRVDAGDHEVVMTGGSRA
jgi:hypothetical protein